MIGNLIKLIATLNGPTLKTYQNHELIDAQGFYVSADMTRIEHWSFPCEYTQPMSHTPHSEHGLICDGFLSIISGDDAHQICQKVKEWEQHLIKYGVITQ